MAEQTQIIMKLTNERKIREAKEEEDDEKKTRSAQIFCGEEKNCKYIVL